MLSTTNTETHGYYIPGLEYLTAKKNMLGFGLFLLLKVAELIQRKTFQPAIKTAMTWVTRNTCRKHDL